MVTLAHPLISIKSVDSGVTVQALATAASSSTPRTLARMS
jgi:hypothetical protein